MAAFLPIYFDKCEYRSSFIPILSTAPGPPQSTLSEEGRTHKVSFSPKFERISVKSGILPETIALIALNERATVFGTGKSNLISLCKHFARPPCEAADILAVDAIKS